MTTINAASLLGLTSVGQQLTAGLRLVASSDGGLIMSADGPSVVVTVTEPSPYAGTYVVPTVVAETTPIPLLAPVVEGTPSIGATLRTRAALWIVESQVPDARRWRWQRDGVDIPGADAPDYTVSAADAGSTLAVVESFDAGAGSIDIASAGVAA